MEQVVEVCPPDAKDYKSDIMSAADMAPRGTMTSTEIVLSQFV